MPGLKKTKFSAKLPDQKFRGGDHQTLKTPFFSLRVRENNAGKNRFGVVVSIAVHKSAVKRNFWKRQAREAARAIEHFYGDMLVTLFPKVNALTKKKFREELLNAAKKFQKNK